MSVSMKKKNYFLKKKQKQMEKKESFSIQKRINY